MALIYFCNQLIAICKPPVRRLVDTQYNLSISLSTDYSYNKQSVNNNSVAKISEISRRVVHTASSNYLNNVRRMMHFVGCVEFIRTLQIQESNCISWFSFDSIRTEMPLSISSRFRNKEMEDSHFKNRVNADTQAQQRLQTTNWMNHSLKLNLRFKHAQCLSHIFLAVRSRVPGTRFRW